MKNLKDKLTPLIGRLRSFADEGMFHIFGSSVLAQAGGLLSSMIVVRGLPKVEYGHYVSANNLYSYLTVFLGLGLGAAAMQYCSERASEGRKNAIHRYALSTGTAANFLVCAVILGLAAAKRQAGDPSVARYLVLMTGLPFVVYLNSYLLTALRVRLDNQGYSYSNIVCTVVTLVGNILFTHLYGIPGLITSTYLANVAGIAASSVALQKRGYFSGLRDRAETLPPAFKREITGYALTCSLTNFASTMLVLLDVTCLDLVLGDKTVLADYKVASTIPAACSFIPSCLVTFFYPKLVHAFSVDREQGRKMLGGLTKIFLLVNSGVYLCLALGAPLIIWIVYGEKYMGVVPIFELLSVNYLIYSIRSLYGNVIASVKKPKINLLFAVISGIVNIALNLLLIPRFGSAGAASATITVTALVGTMSILYMQNYCKAGEP